MFETQTRFENLKELAQLYLRWNFYLQLQKFLETPRVQENKTFRCAEVY